MTTQKAYLAEPQILTAEAQITALINQEKPAVRLDKTYFHPQGGGQKGDRGRIGSVPVLDTKHAEDGEVDHFVENFEHLIIGQTYAIQIDQDFRRINAANHSAGHLIAAVVEPVFTEIKAVQGHHWPGEARVEFAGTISEDLISRLTAFLQPTLDKAISEKWPVSIIGDPFVNRSIKLGAAESVPCGGTHIQHLGQIESIVVKSIKKKSERLRVNYDAFVNHQNF